MLTDYDVVICGAGLVGLTLANAIGKTGLRIAIVDAQPPPEQSAIVSPALTGQDLRSGYGPRVSALNMKTVKFLTRLGVWTEVQRCSSFEKMLVRDSRGSAYVEFTAAEIGESQLGYIVENRTVLCGLTAGLEAMPRVSTFWCTKLEALSETEAGYQLTLNGGQVFNTRLLVGADGGNSRIRQLCKIRTFGWSYDQEALVTTVQTEKPHGNVARQWFTAEGPLAFLPLADPDLSSIVWSVEDASVLKALTTAELCPLLSDASEMALGKVIGADMRFSFPLSQQHSLRYVKPNMALIGDAAHTIHPLAGQGANLGFADVEALAVELAQSQLEGRGIGDIELLKRYERARQPHNLLMTAVMEGFKRLYSTGDPATNWLRNTGMKFVNRSGLLK